MKRRLLLLLLSLGLVACSGTSQGTGSSSSGGSSSGSSGVLDRALECRRGGADNLAVDTCICRRDGAFATPAGKSPIPVTTCDTTWNQSLSGGEAACCASSTFEQNGVGYCSCHPPRKIGCGTDSVSSGLCFCNSLEHKVPLTRCTPQTHGPACCKSKTVENFCTCGLACDSGETQVPSCEPILVPAKCSASETSVASCSE